MISQFNAILKKILIVLYLCVSTCLFAQNNCDCEFLKDENENVLNDPKGSSDTYNLSKRLKSSKSKSCKFYAYSFEFKYYYEKKKIQEALKSLNEQEEILKDLNCNGQLDYYFHYNKTLYYKLTNNFENLSEFAFKALKEAEKSKNKDLMIQIIKEIVFLFTRMQEESKRWEYVKLAEKLILSNKNESNVARNYIWLAFQLENEYTKTERRTLIDSALMYANIGKKTAIKYGMDKEIANSYRVLEAFSYHQGDLENAIVYIDSAIFYAAQIKGLKDLSGLYLSKSWDYFDLKQYEEASKWMDSALFYDDIEDIAGHMMLLSQASEIYEGSGKPDKALSSLKLYSQLKDTIMSKQRSEVVNELETKYQTEVKDAKIKRLSSWLILTSLGVVSLILVTTLVRLRQSRKQNQALKIAFDKQIQLEKELSDVRDEIAQDFHDDLGNKLARISLLSNLISGEVSIKDPKVKLKIKQITEDANGLYRGTRDFVFSLKSNSDYVEEIATYLSDFGKDLFDNTKVKFLVKKDISANEKLPHYWSKHLIFIFKEALTNALKHSRGDTVKLTIMYEKGKLCIACGDNGKGLSYEDMSSDNGFSNMKYRASKIGGLLQIDSKKENGTTITFNGNIHQK